jgi:hypothetical protein
MKLHFRHEAEAEDFCRAAYRAINFADYAPPDDPNQDEPIPRDEHPWSDEADYWLDELDEHGFAVVDHRTFIWSADRAQLRQLQREGRA